MFIEIASPGKDGDTYKNQDWGRHCQSENVFSAIVCDGTTTSPRSEQAARYVAGCAKEIFGREDALRGISETLLRHRAKLLNRPIKLSAMQQTSRHMFEAIILEKRKISYQTTLVAAQWENLGSTLNLRWVGCGDSAIFVFGRNGTLRLSNLAVGTENAPFRHTNPFTEVIPDSYRADKHAVSAVQSLPRDSSILLCSDGFYDGFETFREIYEWMRENWSSIRDDKKLESVNNALHERLTRRKGDDDIYAILWFDSSTASSKAPRFW